MSHLWNWDWYTDFCSTIFARFQSKSIHIWRIVSLCFHSFPTSWHNPLLTHLWCETSANCFYFCVLYNARKRDTIRLQPILDCYNHTTNTFKNKTETCDAYAVFIQLAQWVVHNCYCVRYKMWLRVAWVCFYCFKCWNIIACVLVHSKLKKQRSVVSK